MHRSDRAKLGRVVDVVLDAALLLLAQLDSVAVEYLNAVVLGRIVRRGNNYAAKRLVLDSHARDSRRGEYADLQDLRAAALEPLDERRFYLRTGYPRIAPDDYRALAEISDYRKPHLVRERAVEVVAVLSPYAVSPEIFAHSNSLNIACRVRSLYNTLTTHNDRRRSYYRRKQYNIFI